MQVQEQLTSTTTRAPSTSSTTTTSTTPAPPVSIETYINNQRNGTVQIRKENIQTKCSRFQFACHSGECIAVYNVSNFNQRILFKFLFNIFV